MFIDQCLSLSNVLVRRAPRFFCLRYVTLIFRLQTHKIIAYQVAYVIVSKQRQHFTAMNSDSVNCEMVPIDESIRSSFSVLVTIFESNDIESVIELADVEAANSLYHCSLKAKIMMLKAALTLDPDDLKNAKKTTNRCLRKCDQLRKKKMQKFTNMFSKKNYADAYSDMELHAELLYATVIGCKSFLGLLTCDYLSEFAKIALDFGIAMQIFSNCHTIFEKRTKWESANSKTNFEAALRLERGLRNLVISFLPPKLLKIVNFLGFQGERDLAFAELNKAAFELFGIYSLLAELIVIIYWLYIEMHSCQGPANMDAMQKLIDKKVQQYPKSVLYKVTQAKLIQIKGDVFGAISHFDRLIEQEKDIFHKIFHWELMWTHAACCDWDRSIKYAQQLREHTMYSPAIVTYLEAILRYMKATLENDADQAAQAEALLTLVPSLRMRYLGKTMTFEKAVIVQAQRFLSGDRTMVLPILESMYNINYIYLLNGNDDLSKKWYQIVENEMTRIEQLSENKEKYYTALFFKGILLKHMTKYDEATECFNMIINEKHLLKSRYRHIVPQASLEIGLIALATGDHERAKFILQNTIKNYTKYLSENFVHLKSYAALRTLGVNMDKTG